MSRIEYHSRNNSYAFNITTDVMDPSVILAMTSQVPCTHSYSHAGTINCALIGTNHNKGIIDAIKTRVLVTVSAM